MSLRRRMMQGGKNVVFVEKVVTHNRCFLDIFLYEPMMMSKVRYGGEYIAEANTGDSFILGFFSSVPYNLIRLAANTTSLKVTCQIFFDNTSTFFRTFGDLGVRTKFRFESGTFINEVTSKSFSGRTSSAHFVDRIRIQQTSDNKITIYNAWYYYNEKKYYLYPCCVDGVYALYDTRTRKPHFPSSGYFLEQ